MDPINPDGTIIVSGSVVDGSPGWGFVNHSSEVDFKNNVAHDTVGAGFVGEAGDETGIMKWNIAIHMTGSGQLAQEGGAANGRSRKRMDFGHSGHGIWAQGPAIEMEGNVVAGARGRLFCSVDPRRSAGISPARLPEPGDPPEARQAFWRTS